MIRTETSKDFKNQFRIRNLEYFSLWLRNKLFLMCSFMASKNIPHCRSIMTLKFYSMEAKGIIVFSFSLLNQCRVIKKVVKST